jgi:hypothetical protein
VTYYDNPGQVNDEAISIVDGKTFQVIQIADSAGNIVDPASGSVVFDGSVTISSEVEIKNDTGNPIPTAVPLRTPTTTRVASSASSVTILAANTGRRGLSIHNQSSQTLYLSYTSPATSVNSFISMAPESFLLLDQQLMVSNAIYGIWSGVNGAAQVTEYV